MRKFLTAVVLIFSLSVEASDIRLSFDTFTPILPNNEANGLVSTSSNKTPASAELIYIRDNGFGIGVGVSQMGVNFGQRLTASRAMAAYSAEQDFQYILLAFNKIENHNFNLLLNLNVGTESFTFKDRNSPSLGVLKDSFLRMDIGSKVGYCVPLFLKTKFCPELGGYLIYKNAQEFYYQSINFNNDEVANRSINFFFKIGLSIHF